MFIIKINIKKERISIINFYNNISKIVIIIILRYILRHI